MFRLVSFQPRGLGPLFVLLLTMLSPASCTLIASPGDNITVYTALEESQATQYRNLFSRENPGITVTLLRQSSGILTETLEGEAQSPKADVIWGLAVTNLLNLARPSLSLIQPYTPQGSERIVNPAYRDSGHLWTGNDVYLAAFCVNTKKIKVAGADLPRNWADLRDNAVYKGHIVMPDPQASGTGFTIVSGILQNLDGSTIAEPAPGWMYLQKLDLNVTTYTTSGSAPCDLAADPATATWIGVSLDYAATHLAGTNPDMKAIFPPEGTGWEIEANALIQHGAIQPAARIFLDWAIGDSAMEAYREYEPITAVPIISSRPLPPGYPTPPDSARFKNNSFSWSSGNRDTLILPMWCTMFRTKSLINCKQMHCFC